MASPAPISLQPTQLPLGPSKSTSHLASFSSPHPPLPSPILSRASSRVSFAPRPISTSKSASILTGQPTNTRKQAQTPSPPTPLRPALKSSVSHTLTRGTVDTVGEEWWLQTASALTLAAAESKGQAWLATRSSSTSLGNDEDAEEEDAHRIRSHDYSTRSSHPHGQLSPLTPQHLPPASPYSASRRGSAQPKESRSNPVTFSPVHHESLREEPEQPDLIQGPIFVDLTNEEDERYLRRSYSERGSDVDEEGEMRRLVRGSVGGWVDYFVGWMDFRGDELDESTEEVEDDKREGKEDGLGNSEKGKIKRQKEKMETNREKASLAEEGGTREIMVDTDAANGETGASEEGGAWSDAKWLLGVASKAIF